tara:strand:- start:3547 stop:5142 length:1596 start_codon:yes stop_codon:yes gene_type:complete
MADQKVNIKVSTSGAKKAKGQLGGVSGSIRKMGSAVIGASAAYFGTRGLISAITTSTELAGIQEQAEKKLEVALGRTSKSLLNQASALQKVTTFGDESIIGVQASIAAFVDSEEAIKKATAATLDIAVAMGMDLKSAGDLVAKTLGSSTNAMSRYGIEVTGAVGSSERLESLTGNVAKLFGGQAAAQADTYAGSVQQLKNELGDMAEDIGRILIPVFQNLRPHLQSGIDALRKILKQEEENEKVTSSYSEKIKKSSEMINLLRERTDGLTTSNIFQKRHTEEGLELLERARNKNVKAIDLLKAEKQLLGELIAEKFKLNKLHEREIELREAGNVQSGINLQLRKAEIDMGMEYVEVIDPATKGNRLFAASYGDIADASTSALKQTSDLLAATAGSSKSQQIQAMKLAQFAAIADTASGVMKAFKQGGTLGFITGAGIAATGAAQVATIQQAIANAQGAETGFDGIVNKPTLFMTGENNKAERVSVTPLEGVNINGPQGGGMTLNITAPLIDEHILDTIIPAIENAQKQNLA